MTTGALQQTLYHIIKVCIFCVCVYLYQYWCKNSFISLNNHHNLLFWLTWATMLLLILGPGTTCPFVCSQLYVLGQLRLLRMSSRCLPLAIFPEIFPTLTTHSKFTLLKMGSNNGDCLFLKFLTSCLSVFPAWQLELKLAGRTVNLVNLPAFITKNVAHSKRRTNNCFGHLPHPQVLFPHLMLRHCVFQNIYATHFCRPRIFDSLIHKHP